VQYQVGDIELVLGHPGVSHARGIPELISATTGVIYQLTDLRTFEALAMNSIDNMAGAYWRELLHRTHWAASANLRRHFRWYRGCLSASLGDPNLPAFAACLRGLIEGAGDVAHRLMPIPLTLAKLAGDIRSALAGRAASVVICEDMERRLIHFDLASRSKPSAADPLFSAKNITEYLGSIDTGKDVLALYVDLCEVVHPAFGSLNWPTERAVSEHVERWRVIDDTDADAILLLCRKHRAAIDKAQMVSVNCSVLCLRVLNEFPLPQLTTPMLGTWDLSFIRGWEVIRGLLTASSSTRPH
jgi:hypothetical protein